MYPKHGGTPDTAARPRPGSTFLFCLLEKSKCVNIPDLFGGGFSGKKTSEVPFPGIRKNHQQRY